MKSTITLLSLLTFCQLNAQISTSLLQYNNAGGIITDAGIFFADLGTQLPGYEIPEGSDRNIIYSSAFWFGGKDVGGQVKLAAQNIYNQGSDLWPGALTVDGTANVVTPNPLGQTIWNVSRAEILNHISNYNQPGYVTPFNIENWPANGDVSMNQSAQLAPYVDLNMNGLYEPELGEYPCIKGDQTVYTIMNDKQNVHYSGGEPLGIEVHFMFYQFASNDALDNTTFADVHVFNRGTQTIYDFTTSFMMDGDLGGPSDDFVGCDTTRNLAYQYNGDDFDEGMAGITGYGSNPPSFGIMCLSDSISSFRSFNITDPAASGAAEILNLMSGLNSDGSPILNNTAQETRFQFYDNPNNILGWSEVSSSNAPGDRRSLVSVTQPVLSPFTSVQYSFAIVYSRDGLSNLDNVNELMTVADEIQTYYDVNLVGECESVLGSTELNLNNVTVFPNPSQGTFNVFMDGQDIEQIVVRDMTGREVYRTLNLGQHANVQLNTAPGIYTIEIQSNARRFTKTIVLE